MIKDIGKEEIGDCLERTGDSDSEHFNWRILLGDSQKGVNFSF